MIADFNFQAEEKIIDEEGNITWKPLFEVGQPLIMSKLVISALNHPDVPIGDKERKKFLANELTLNGKVEITSDDLAMLKELARSELAFSASVMDCLQNYLNTIK